MPAFCYRLPIRFADVDHAGIVYYPRFFHYFHVTFEEFFRERIGTRSYVRLLDEDRIGFPSVRAECDYLAPLKFGDMAEIRMTVARVGDKSVTFAYEVYRCDETDQGEECVLAARGSNTSAVVDLSLFRSVAVPQWLRTLFDELTA